MKVWVHNKNYLQTPKTMSTTFSKQCEQTYVLVATSYCMRGAMGFGGQEWRVFFFKAANENSAKMKIAGLKKYFECLNEDSDRRKFNLEYSLSQYDIVALDGPAGYNRLKNLEFEDVEAFMTIDDPEVLEDEAYEKMDEVGEMNEEELEDLYNAQDAEIRRDVYALTFRKGECVGVHEVEVRREEEKKIRFMFDKMTVDNEMVGYTADNIVCKINEGIDDWKYENDYDDNEKEEEWKDITVEEGEKEEGEKKKEEEEEVMIVEVKKAKIEIIDLTGEDEEEVVMKKEKVKKEKVKKKEKSKSVQCSHVFTRGEKKDKRCKTKTKKENGLCSKHSKN